MDRSAKALERAIGCSFRNADLLAEALTHRSFANESGSPLRDNERLEFLGDAVLGLVVSDALFSRSPGISEGELSRVRALLVSGANLVDYARKLELGAWLRLGVGEERSGGREKATLLVNAFEALVGALYLDQGLEVTRRVVLKLLDSQLSEYSGTYLNAVDSKSILQEMLHTRGHSPEYLIVEESGPDHQKLFRVEVRVDGRVVGEGTGLTKKAAEQAAATLALETGRAGDGPTDRDEFGP